MNHLATKASLSPNRQRLIEAMQQLNFGRIEGLEVYDGDPTFSPPPKLIQDIKLGADNGPRAELVREDFVLRAQVVELFEHLHRVGNGTIAAIDVRYGLPIRLVVERRRGEELL
jgi:hypothetical protein